MNVRKLLWVLRLPTTFLKTSRYHSIGLGGLFLQHDLSNWPSLLSALLGSPWLLDGADCTHQVALLDNLFKKPLHVEILASFNSSTEDPKLIGVGLLEQYHF